MEMATRSGTKIKLNVRGVHFEVKASTLESFPNCLLSSLDHNSKYWDDEMEEYFFERDPGIFNAILNMYTIRELHVPKTLCISVFRKEMEFWRIPISSVSECCWKTLYQIDEATDVVEHLRKASNESSSKAKVDDTIDSESFRYRIWLAIENPKSSRTALVSAMLLMLLFIYVCY